MRLFYVFGLALGLASGPALTTSAQQLDPGFAPSTITSPGGGVQAMAKQADGKVVVSGDFQTMNGQAVSQVVRLNVDGSPDLAFRTQTGSGPNQIVSAVAVQADGKIVLGGQYGLSHYNGVPVTNPVRLNADGSLDASFVPGGTGWTGEVRSVVVQPDGKILVAGSLYSRFNGQPTHGLIRLLPNGTLDTSFNTGSGFAGTFGDQLIAELALQPDGKIVAAGSFATVDGYAQAGVARLNANGSFDPSFTSPLPAQGIVLGLALQPDGKVLVGGAQLASSGTAQLLRRLLPNGTPDATFLGGPDSGIIIDLNLRADGSLLVVGSFGSYNGVPRSGLARVSTNGTLDTSFANSATGSYNTLLKATELNNGQYLIGGYFDQVGGQTTGGLARLTVAGQPDASYNQPLGYLPSVPATPLTNGQLLLSLPLARFNGQLVGNSDYRTFHRVNADGTYNAAVALPAGTPRPNSSTPYAYRAIAQADGTFYAAYQSSDSTAVLRRILTTGAFDPAFAATELRWSKPYPYDFAGVSIAVHPAGGLLVTGTFTKVNGLARPSVARLLANGTPNTQFAPPATAAWQVPNPGMGSTAGFREAVGLANGQTLVLWNDANRSYLERLNANGSTDNTFSIGTGGGATASFGILGLASGKILVNGDFTTFNGQAAPNGLLRLLATGAPDAGFVAARASRYTVEQPDGRLLIVAPGTNPQNVNITRLLDNGSLDSSFQPVPVLSGTRAPAAPMLYLQPGTQAIVLSGDFTSVAGQPRYGLARLVNVALATRGATAVPLAEAFPNPAHEQLSLRLPAPPTGPVLLADLQGRTVRRWSLAQACGTVPLAGLAPGVYLLGIATAAGQSWQRVVIE
ncbi:T9SS type A sorting domain-containing protein [Hymenobacter negativus]|uniref:T9SS type A sorting domain-containing protein n=1 Tax=Hymenobacter negativus TaxID=2795026 RepID=A0ABS0QD81_9BACT|nr:T9SS type A sorting domain-containing protein [Hymenobacter negativus]MBH8560156.1 T9SS type A sorting domain-containing protein [Hymenobacter negativus]